MPPLKNLICRVEWDSPDNLPLQEYDTTYGDGFVESYLAIPRNPTQFTIHLTSHGYIAPGLAMYVFIDDEYQCNRNRPQLLMPAESFSRKDFEVDFRLRQKEFSGPDGMWEGHQWKFDKVGPGKPGPVQLTQHGRPDDFATPMKTSIEEDEHAASIGRYSGKIDVLVLRCHHLNSPKRSSSSSSLLTRSDLSRRSSYMDIQKVPMMTGAIFDGAGDPLPPKHCGPSGKFRERAEKESLPILGLRGGGASPPQSTHRRSRQHCRGGDQKKNSSFSVGGGLVFLGEKSDLSGSPWQRTEQQSHHALGLRGGDGSQSSQSKKGTPSPALSSKSFRLGSGDLPSRTKSPKTSTSSYTPENTWSTPRSTRSMNGSTGSYTPDDSWDNSGKADLESKGQTGGSWTWEPGNSVSHSFSTHRRRENQQGDISSASSIKRHTAPTKTWTPAGKGKEKENQEDERWDGYDNSHNERWGSINNDDNQQREVPDPTGDDNDNMPETGWDTVNHSSNNDDNCDQNDDWGSTNKIDRNHRNAHGSNISNRSDEKNNSNVGNGRHKAGNNGRAADNSDAFDQFKSWDKAGATGHNEADQSRSLKTPGKAMSPADGTKPHIIRGKTTRSPSNASLKSALKSPFKAWVSNKALPKKISDKVVKKAATMPGAWSPPLEKAEKKSRSESTKRRAAEFNAERAKAHAAELGIESSKTGSQRSKPATPPTSILKPSLKSTPSAPSNCKPKIFRTHQKRRSTNAEETPVDVDVVADNGASHEARSVSPASYIHKTGTPPYMDTIDEPYAHFVFHYRDMAVISKMCNMNLVETGEQLRSRLASLTKQELLEMLIEERLAAEEMDEKLTWKTSPDKAGCRPNLDAANEKLDEWGHHQTYSGESDGGNKRGGLDESKSGNGSGNMDTANGSQDNPHQEGDSWGNGDGNHSGGDAGWGAWDIGNDNHNTDNNENENNNNNNNNNSAGEYMGGEDRNPQDDNYDNGFGGGNGGGNDEGW